MTVPVGLSRRALSLLPACGVTGVGSLPHTQLELGLQLSLQFDIPFLPQLPISSPSEFMIASALDGLPGVVADEEGLCTVDLGEWERTARQWGGALEASLASGSVEAFEPSATANRSWRPFLWEIENRKLALAKVHLAGPATVRWVAKTSAGGSISDHPHLDQQAFQFLLAKSLAMVKAVRRAGATPVFFLDEPGLYALERGNPRHIVVLQELKMLTLALQQEGALVGLHCCSNTDWAAIFGLGLDIVSLDARLSLDAALEERDAFIRFLDAGGTLSLGIIPTNLNTSYEVNELVDGVDAAFRSVLSQERAFRVLSSCLLTPACGLAMRSVADTERIVGELRQAQMRFKKLVGV